MGEGGRRPGEGLVDGGVDVSVGGQQEWEIHLGNGELRGVVSGRASAGVRHPAAT